MAKTVIGKIEIYQNISEQLAIAKKAMQDCQKVADELTQDLGELEKQKVKPQVDTSEIDAVEKETEQAKKAVKGMDNARGTAKIDADTTAANSAISDLKRKITGYAATIGVTAVVKSAVISGLDYNTQMESYNTAFSTMLGDAEKGNALMADLQKTASATPFELSDLTGTTQLLMQYGMSADTAKNSMMMLGDISQGNADKMSRVAAAYGQMSSAGKVQLEDIKQMIEAGFNPLNEISTTTGESMASLYDRISKGTIAVDEITASMQRSTSEGGKYYGSMEAQSQTMAGLKSTAEDLYKSFMGDVTGNMFDRLKGGITDLNSELGSAKMQTYAKEIGNTLGDVTEDVIALAKGLWDNKEAVIAVAAGFGAFKIASAAGTFIEGMVGSFKALKTATTAATTAQEALNVAEAASPIGAIALVIGGVVAGFTALAAAAAEANAPLTDAVDDIKDMEDAYNSAMDAAKSNYDSQITDTKLMRKQVDDLDEMIRSGADNRKLDLAAEDLIKQFPQLEGAIEKVNGKWVVQKDKVNDVIEAVKQEAIAELAKDKLKTALAEQSTAQDNIKAKKDEQTQYIADNQDKYKEYIKYKEEYAAAQNNYSLAEKKYETTDRTDGEAVSAAEAQRQIAQSEMESAKIRMDASGGQFAVYENAINELIKASATADTNAWNAESEYNSKVYGDTTEKTTESTTSSSQYTSGIMSALDDAVKPLAEAAQKAQEYITAGNTSYGLQYASANGLSISDDDIKKAGSNIGASTKLLDDALIKATNDTLINTKAMADTQLKDYKDQMSYTERTSLETYSKTLSDALNTSSKTAGDSMATAIAWIKSYKLPIDITVKTTGSSATTTSVTGASDTTSKPAQNAIGDPYFEGGMTWVGERGPELINLPKGTQIHDAGSSRELAKEAAAGGATNNVTVNVTIQRVDAEDDGSVNGMLNKIVDAIKKAV